MRCATTNLIVISQKIDNIHGSIIFDWIYEFYKIQITHAIVII